jgi:hypothetical protein
VIPVIRRIVSSSLSYIVRLSQEKRKERKEKEKKRWWWGERLLSLSLRGI